VKLAGRMEGGRGGSELRTPAAGRPGKIGRGKKVGVREGGEKKRDAVKHFSDPGSGGKRERRHCERPGQSKTPKGGSVLPGKRRGGLVPSIRTPLGGFSEGWKHMAKPQRQEAREEREGNESEL